MIYFKFKGLALKYMNQKVILGVVLVILLGTGGYFAFVKTTQGPIHEFLFRTENSGIKALECTRHLFSITTSCSITV